MKFSPTSLLLVPSTVLLCFIFPLVGSVLRPVFVHGYQIRSDAELRAIMPAATRFAADCAWVFAVVGGSLGMSGFLLSQMSRAASDRPAVIALCMQGITAWAACLCIFYSAFTEYSIHHGDMFEWDLFITFGGGVFPLTFIAFLLPLFRAALPQRPGTKPDIVFKA